VALNPAPEMVIFDTEMLDPPMPVVFVTVIELVFAPFTATPPKSSDVGLKERPGGCTPSDLVPSPPHELASAMASSRQKILTPR